MIVSRLKIPAANGKLIFVCGGDTAVFDQLQPEFGVMGKLAKFYGPIGYGAHVHPCRVLATCLCRYADEDRGQHADGHHRLCAGREPGSHGACGWDARGI